MSPYQDSGNQQYYENGLEQQWQVDSHNQYLQTQHKKELNMADLNDLNFDQLVPTNSKYLTKNDVGDDGIILTIKGFKTETIEGDHGDEEKVIMYFVEDVNPMVLNRTNSQLVGIATGAANAGEARGKQVVVYNDPSISFGGKITGGIRIKKIAGAPRPAPAKVAIEDIDSDVPFDSDAPY